MKHLVIGAGNMGKRHGYILESLRDSVDYVDVDNPLDKWRSMSSYDSALICTPPETHVEIINQIKMLTREKLPVFCEKPLYTQSCDIIYKGLSMVACNWRFCNCKEFRISLDISYPNAISLDLIHFVDVLWDICGKPLQKADAVMGANAWYLCGYLPTGKHDKVEFMIRNKKRVASIVHHCDMFTKQMKSWRRQIMNKKLPINPIKMAKERTDWLIDLLADSRA